MENATAILKEIASTSLNNCISDNLCPRATVIVMNMFCQLIEEWRQRS